MKNTKSQNGNVLFFILIAVVLFASLTYAVTRDGSGGAGNMATSENARIAASDLLRSLTDMKEGYNYLRTIGCSIDDIEFDYPATTNLNCQLFHPDGGGIKYPNHWNTYQTEAAAGFSQVGVIFFNGPSDWSSGANAGSYKHEDIGTSAQDMLVRFNFLPDDICIAYNQLLGLDFASLPTESSVIMGATDINLRDKQTACSKRTNISPAVNQISFVLEGF